MEQELIYPSGAHELTPVLSGVGINRSLTLCFVDLCSVASVSGLSILDFSFGFI
jgi:hypothetical protein